MDIKTAILDATNFLVDCSAGLAATYLVHPLDLMKICMQLNDTKSATNSEIVYNLKKEGIPAMYSGLSASLIKQAGHITTRYGICRLMLKYVLNNNCSDFWIYMGLLPLAGCVSSFLWTPAEIAFVRMAADRNLPDAEKRNYKNVIDALIRITKEEGFLTLWKGAVLTPDCEMIRVALLLRILTILGRRMYLGNSIMASYAISGIVLAAIVTPIDVIKTRVQSIKAIKNNPKNADIARVFTQILRNEGIGALWKGFLPHYARLELHLLLKVLMMAAIKLRLS